MNNTMEWWRVVEALSQYVTMGIEIESIYDDHVYQALLAEGYSSEVIDSALTWLEEASLSCEISEILANFQPISKGVRIPTSLEEKYIPTKIQQHIERAKASGLLSMDYSEKLRESLLSMDAKEWSERDQFQFLIEVLQSTLPQHDAEAVRKFILGKSSDFYC